MFPNQPSYFQPIQTPDLVVVKIVIKTHVWNVVKMYHHVMEIAYSLTLSVLQRTIQSGNRSPASSIHIFLLGIKQFCKLWCIQIQNSPKPWCISNTLSNIPPQTYFSNISNYPNYAQWNYSYLRWQGTSRWTISLGSTFRILGKRR